MFDKLSEGFSSLFKKMSGKDTITRKNIEEALEDIKKNLLEADVNIRVVRRFLASIEEEALGMKVLNSLSPYEQFVKIVHDKLVNLLGEGKSDLNLKNPKEISTLLILGLQGSGKTSTSAKLAKYLKDQGKFPLLVACDLLRPAAKEQLTILADQIEVPIFSPKGVEDEVEIIRLAYKEAQLKMCNILIIDTAGRLEIDDSLMTQLSKIKDIANPDESLLVMDSMMGQGAFSIAQSFSERIGFTGFIISKFDSDAKGGVVLSVKSLIKKPVKFITVGEKVSDLELFYPSRIASRILGMGDIVSLAEKAQSVFDEKESLATQKKLLKGEFSLLDYLNQMKSLSKMGGVSSLMSFLPNMGNVQLKEKDFNFKKEEAIILSMTEQERRNSHILGPSRRKRIAKGSGTTLADIARLLKKFNQVRSMMRKFSKDKSVHKQLFSLMEKRN